MGGDGQALRLRLKSLMARRGSFQLGPITLELGVGLHAVLGPNGAGKTTLLAAVVGHVRRRGEALLGNVEIDARNAWRFVSANLAEPPMGFNATILDYARVYLGRVIDDWDERVSRYFAELGLEDMLERSWESLSAGQRSLAILLVTLAKPAPLVLLDEPFTHLDPHWYCKARQLLAREARSRIIVYTTHEFDSVANADSVILMRDGRIITAGDPKSTLRPEILIRVYGVGFQVRDSMIRPYCNA